MDMRVVKRLYDMGFAIHWLKPRSKAPVNSKWTTGKRATWNELKAQYRKGYNVGVRLGKASRIEDPIIGDGLYLGVIDIDVKSKKRGHLNEVRDKVKELGVTNSIEVESGRGNGSRHIYILTDSPQAPFRYSQSSEKVKVYMPSSKPSRHELKVLTKEELKKGVRLRPAWEVSIMGEGQQVVLPPSIHPDSKKPYRWGSLGAPEDFESFKQKTFSAPEKVDDFKDLEGDVDFINVDISVSNLSDKDKALIIEGEGSVDRSAELLSVCNKMIRHGYTDKEILSVLTNRDYYLGSVAFEHKKTRNRQKAAEWVYKYTLAKAERGVKEVVDAFTDIVENEKLSKDEAKKQAKELADSGDWRDELSRVGNKKDGPPRATMKNMILILENTMLRDDFIGRNRFTLEDVWLTDTPWGNRKGTIVSDSDVIRLKQWLSHNFRVEPARDKIDEVLIYFAEKNAFHPVKSYLDSLEWDGIERLDTWLQEYLGVEGPDKYISAVGRKTLVAMVARIYKPGVKFDNVLILEGKQGVGKSTTARILAGDDWFSDSDLLVGDKDAVVNMQGVWVYEIGELSAMRRYHVNQLKEFISRSTDKIRPPYGKRLVSFPRQSIFIGTTNNSEYLKDKTGNRRFWPVRVGDVDLDWLSEDRDQLLAEAVEAFRSGESLYLEDYEVRKLAEIEQGIRVEYDEIQGDVEQFLNSLELEHSDPKSDKLGIKGPFRVSDLLSQFTGIDGLRNDRLTQMRITDALKNLNYEKKRMRFKGINASFWVKND